MLVGALIGSCDVSWDAPPAAVTEDTSLPILATVCGFGYIVEADDVNAWYRSPVELGWAKNIKFDHDFTGRKALEAEVANPKRTMVTLVWNADDVIDVYASLFRQGKPYHYMDMPRDQRGFMYADKVLKGDELVGAHLARTNEVSNRRDVVHQVVSRQRVDRSAAVPSLELDERQPESLHHVERRGFEPACGVLQTAAWEIGDPVHRLSRLLSQRRHQGDLRERPDVVSRQPIEGDVVERRSQDDLT